MADFNIRSDSVNVEQIMQQIRARIREKRGVDYTEEQIRELAAVKLETFPQSARRCAPGCCEQFRRAASRRSRTTRSRTRTLFESHRAPLRWIRRLLRPFLKLFFNPNPLIRGPAPAVGHQHASTRSSAQISFELLHNLVLETTRLGIEVKNLKMRVESLSSRFDFAERRARALEGLVQARLEGRATSAPPARARPAAAAPRAVAPSRSSQVRGPQRRRPAAAAAAAATRRAGEPAASRRRRRRRRGRASGAGDARRRRGGRRGRRSGEPAGAARTRPPRQARAARGERPADRTPGEAADGRHRVPT